LTIHQSFCILILILVVVVSSLRIHAIASSLAMVSKGKEEIKQEELTGKKTTTRTTD